METYTQIKDKAIPLSAQDGARDIYSLDARTQLVVYTDRIYAHGVPLDAPLPGKGVMLNEISKYWMNRFTHLTANDLSFQDVKKFPEAVQPYAPMLHGRSVITMKLKPLPFQFFVVGSLGGAYWKEYSQTGMIRGQSLPRGMLESTWLDQSLFVPISTSDSGRNDDGRKLALRLLGQKLYASIEEICLSIFGVARNYALARGLTIADTCFQFSMVEGKPCLMNEVMTPDVATYWPGDVEPGEAQPIFERQNVYSWLKLQRWTRSQPLPAFSPELLKLTATRYRELTDIMTGKVATLKHQDDDLPVYDEEGNRIIEEEA